LRRRQRKLLLKGLFFKALVFSRDRFSSLVAGSPNDKAKCRDQADHDEHPVLPFNAEKAEFLNKKLHGSRPFEVDGTLFAVRNILILAYPIVVVAKRFWRR
jgi:hypothetical protein